MMLDGWRPSNINGVAVWIIVGGKSTVFEQRRRAACVWCSIFPSFFCTKYNILRPFNFFRNHHAARRVGEVR